MSQKKDSKNSKFVIPIMILLLAAVVYFINKMDSKNSHSHGDGKVHSHP